MKHNFKDIDKLKQLDRIEYLLKIKAIRDRYDYEVTSINILFIFVGFILLITLGWYSAFRTMPSWMYLIPTVLKIFMFFIFLDYVLYFYNYYLKEKFEKEVYDKFFKTEVKVK